jgi:hypothetical protein
VATTTPVEEPNQTIEPPNPTAYASKAHVVALRQSA